MITGEVTGGDSEPGLAGLPVVSVLIDYSAILRLPERVVVIMAPFTVVTTAGRVRLSPEDDPPEAFDSVQTLVGTTVVQSSIDTVTGSLSIWFSNGTSIDVEPDPAYESWKITGPSGRLIVCGIGGLLSIWGEYS